MARINHVQKAQKDQGPCSKCGKQIVKGDPYKWFQKQRAPKRIACASCTFRDSDLAGGRMADVYAAREEAEDAMQTASTIEDVREALQNAVDRANELADEYEQSAENIRERFTESATADECEEKASAVRDWANEMESAMDNDCEEFDEDDLRTELREEHTCGHCDGDKVISDTLRAVRALGTFIAQQPCPTDNDCPACEGAGYVIDEDELERLLADAVQEKVDNAINAANEAIGSLSL